MRIQKTTETTPLNASVVNVKNNSTTDAYSCDYVNGQLNNKANEWKLLGTISNVGQNYALDIPADAKELNIDCFNLYNDGVSMNIITSNLVSGNNKGYDGGFYKANNDMLRVLIYANSSKIWVQEYVVNSSQISTIGHGCTIHYR